MGLRLQSSAGWSRGLTAPFGFAVLTFVAMPASIGYQDLATTIAQRASLSERLREHGLKSPFGTIHAATFSFPRPIGATIPEPVTTRLASLDVGESDLTGSVALRALLDLSQTAPSEEVATVNRSRKGDRIRALAEENLRKEQAIARVIPPPVLESQAVPSNPDNAEIASMAPAPASLEPQAAPSNPGQTATATATAEPASIASAPAAQVSAIDDRPIEVAALPPSSERETIAREATPPAAAGPAMTATQPSAWDNATAPIATDEAFTSASLAWVGGAGTAVEASAAKPAAASAEPAVVSAEPPAARAKPATASAEPSTRPAVAGAEPPVAKIAEPALAPTPAAERTYVVASASADIELPRPAQPKADISVDAAAAKSPPAANNRLSDTESYRPDTAVPTLGEARSPSLRTARIYFGAEPLAELRGGLEAWAPGAASFLSGTEEDRALEDEEQLAQARLAALRRGGETIVSKGQVPGDALSLLSPADRLGLVGEDRQTAEKCLADAIYFESRGEPVRGQIAVAQVVVNRVFSGYYPTTVCGVVYQNAHRRLACQFTFACDGIPDKITEPDAWERAKTIARETLDGKYWLPDVGKATHYHAYWVRPRWVRTMHKLDKIGVHTFYRPRNWGDGAAQPAWGDAELNVAPAEKL
ncbi:MAG: cell wall hydrolase [Rhodoplanes sp.]